MLDQHGQPTGECRTLSEVLARIGDRWTMLTIGVLGAGPLRFNDIRRAVDGVTQRMLTLTLRALERDGLVLRTCHATVPPAVEYALTERGRTLLAPIVALAQWGKENRDSVEQSRRDYDRSRAELAAMPPAPGVHRLR